MTRAPSLSFASKTSLADHKGMRGRGGGGGARCLRW
jgi:hypothetical protein